MSGTKSCFVVLVVLLSPGIAQAEVIMELVPVGDPGNVADTHGAGYGGVDYLYAMGKYEVTGAQYTEFLNSVAGVDTYGLYDSDMAIDFWGSEITRTGGGTLADPYTYSVTSGSANRPLNFVSWGSAARLANWMHNGQRAGKQDESTTEDGSYLLGGATDVPSLMAVVRKPDATWVIPTEDEWYKAAFYKGGSTNAGYWDYPTSSDVFPGRDLTDESGNNANYGGNPRPIDPPYSQTIVGQFRNSPSPYGTFDQGGNEWEWVEAVMSGGNRRGRRGGSYNWEGATLRAWVRMEANPASTSQSIGMRLALVPEPGAAALLGVGAVGLLVCACCRRRRT